MNNPLHRLRRLLGLPIQQRAPFWTMTPDNTYREVFERLWAANSDEVVSNSLSEHAAALLSVFLTKAEKRVCVFCKNLDRDLYDRPEVLQALDKALQNKVHVEIVVQEPPSVDSEFLHRIAGIDNPDGSAILLNRGDEAGSKLKNIKQNFAFVDGRAFRYELSNHVITAVASAYSPKSIPVLEEFFDTIKKHISSLNVPVSA